MASLRLAPVRLRAGLHPAATHQHHDLEPLLQRLKINRRIPRRLQSTVSNWEEFQSTVAEKGIDGSSHVVPLALRARAVPLSPSYFSREPLFHDSYLRLQSLNHKYGKLPHAPPEMLDRVAWKPLVDYRKALGEEVNATLYARCIALAKKLNKIHPKLKPAVVEDAVAEFRRAINPFLNVMKIKPLDKHGRAIGVGRRKTSTARAWVVEGTGEMLVNGKTLAEAFGRVHDRESASWALRATDRIDRYNVWALTEGGGTTGQAEALAMAVGRALLSHEPALKTALRRGESLSWYCHAKSSLLTYFAAGCLTRDPRMVERKKHGHLKARKMPPYIRR